MATEDDPYDDPNCPDECGCENQSCSGESCPVNYATGGAEDSDSYMSTPNEGNFRLTWFNLWKRDGAPADFTNSKVGINWSIDAFAYKTTNPDNDLIFVWGPGRRQRRVFFNQSGSTYKAMYGARQTLTKDGNTWRITDPDGTVWEFSDIDNLIDRRVSPGGQVTEYLKEDTRVIEKRTTTNGDSESRVFAYDGDNLSTATLYQGTTSNPYATAVRRVVLAYYTATLADKGTVGDLKTVTTQTPLGVSGWVDVSTRYYRYYTASSSIGFVHGLKYVVGPEGYASLTSPDSATDAQVAAVATKYYEYDPVTRKVTKSQTNGGTVTYNIVYAEAANTIDFNHWQLKAVATMSDGSTKTVFANHIGQDMLVDDQAGPDRWITYTQFNDDGRPQLRAKPSAIDMSGMPYTESDPTLAVELNEQEGLIEITTYYAEGSTAPGSAPGYVHEQRLQKGEGSTGTPALSVLLSTLEYGTHTINAGQPTEATVYPVTKRIVFKDADETGAIETSYTNDYYAGTVQLKQVTEYLPDIDSVQNGGAWLADNTRETHYDELGRVTKTVDPRETETTYVYDDATGTVEQMVQDPSGLGLQTDYEADDMGRRTKTLGPAHIVSGQTVRTVQWTVYLDDEHEVRSAQGYLIGSTYTLVNPVTISRSDASGRVTDEIQAKRGSGVENTGELTAADSFPQTSWTRWTHHDYGEDGRRESTRVYHTIPPSGEGSSGANYNQTGFGYDSRGRQNYVKSPAGTITRTEYDARGKVLAVWLGTNDAGATDSDPSGGGATGNNMKAVTVNTYDVNAYGSGDSSLDGLLTKVTSRVDDNASNDRIVEYVYDWRDRPVATTTTDGTNTYQAVSTYDNLNQVTESTTIRAGTPDVLIAKSEAFYDDRGRVYESRRWGVDDSGSTTYALTDETWYDATGAVLKSLPSGSEAFNKNSYDAIGRQTASYTGYYDGSGSDSPLDLTDNVIVEQNETTYDQASNVTQTASLVRYHDGTGTGPLDAGTNARPAYMALYFDGIGRSIATAEYGNQGNDSTPFTRPATVPASSPTVLVSQVGYNAAGEAQDQTNPAGQVTRTVYDAAGRAVTVTQNYGSSPSESVETAYTADGQVETFTAINADTGNQVTSYAYGVTISGSGVASNDLLASVTYPDSGVVQYQYNRQGDRIEMADQNGSVHEYAYDHMGRQTEDEVSTLGAGVDGAVRRIVWVYDDRRRLEHVTSYDAASGGNVTSDVQYAYDAFDQMTIEYQQHGSAVNPSTSPKVQYSYANGSSNTTRRTQVKYPNGTELELGYGNGMNDKLSRVESLTWDGSGVTEYEYLGLSQVVIQRLVEPSSAVEYTLATGATHSYSGMDRFGRIVDLQWNQL